MSTGTIPCIMLKKGKKGQVSSHCIYSSGGSQGALSDVQEYTYKVLNSLIHKLTVKIHVVIFFHKLRAGGKQEKDDSPADRCTFTWRGYRLIFYSR